MSRPLRIEYPDAWYHVMNHGRRADKIFLDATDFRTFFELLIASAELWNVRIAAFCLLSNHYHILLQTPDANLSRFMRHVDGVYTQYFNRIHHCDGQLFRGRYKSILVDADSYLLQLVKYIHRNPLKMEGVKTLDYKWSSHRGYVSVEKKWEWLYKDFIFDMLTKDKRYQHRAYQEFMGEEDSGRIREILERLEIPSVLGSKMFIDWVKDRFFQQKHHQEIPGSRVSAPERKRIKRVVCEAYHVDENVLLKSKRGTFNEARNVAIYLSRVLRGDGLDALCKEFQMRRCSSASSAIERMRNEIAKDSQLRERVDKRREELFNKSQT